MKHAKMLLLYKTYLLYNIEVDLGSIEAFRAINNFLKQIKTAKQKISDKFFRKVGASVDIDWLDEFNEFSKQYLEMGFPINIFQTTLNQNLTEQNVAINENKKPILEFCDYAKYPNNDKCQYKTVYFLDFDEATLRTENLDTLDCLFYYIEVVPDTLKMLYDNQYEFSYRHSAFTSGI